MFFFFKTILLPVAFDSLCGLILDGFCFIGLHRFGGLALFLWLFVWRVLNVVTQSQQQAHWNRMFFLDKIQVER